ncbi:hypothetical protein ACIRU3_39230, partial [Streptomyces sp. NPDC101151]|uniref:hypothetical protein n=1 Tax=Streptomyces sp. NPDC101151 TaxID=3366115 RepID=UPI0037FA92E0
MSAGEVRRCHGRQHHRAAGPHLGLGEPGATASTSAQAASSSSRPVGRPAASRAMACPPVRPAAAMAASTTALRARTSASVSRVRRPRRVRRP